jgi:glutamate synthase domain-containing protein 3
MSGGIAYVLVDDRDRFAVNCNQDMVDLDDIENDQEAAELFNILEEHHRLTGSTVAGDLIKDWKSALTRFIKVMPRDYKRVLAEGGHDVAVTGSRDLCEEITIQQGAA